MCGRIISNTLFFSTPPRKKASLISIPSFLKVLIALVCDGAFLAVTSAVLRIGRYLGF
jgi:hypothetical protein